LDSLHNIEYNRDGSLNAVDEKPTIWRPKIKVFSFAKPHTHKTKSAATITVMTTEPSPKQTPSTTMIEYISSSRIRFALFVKILMKHLKAAGKKDLLTKTILLIAECTSRCRMGDVRFSPLADAIATRLLELVGPDHWARAQGLLHFYIARKVTERRRLFPRRVSL
jgi:hypothetical protein